MIKRLYIVWLQTLFILLLLGEFASQVINLENLNLRLRFIDIWLALFFPFALYFLKTKIPKKLFFSYFVLIAYLFINTLFLSTQLFHANLTGLLYWLRWIIFIIVGLYLFYYPPPLDYLRLFSWGIVFIGFFQYLLFPTIDYYNPEGWDPHYFRLFGSFLNPNLYGLVLLFFLIYWLSFKSKTYQTKLLIIVFLLAIFLTFSRTLYLLTAFSLLILHYQILKQRFKTYFFIIIFTGISLVVSLIFIGHLLPGEGVKIWRTSTIKSRLAEYQQAVQIISQHPITGIGFNNIKLYKTRYLFQDLNSHSLSWFSSSLTSIIVTSGVLGLMIWIWFGYNLYQQLNTLPGRLMFWVWLLHAEFHASLFYGFLIITFFILSGFLNRPPNP